MVNDAQLLQRYASGENGHEEAFAELVRRYLNLVYSVALRMLSQDAHRAEDVTQLVFANLARRAANLPAETVLAGWLHRDTCHKALETLRVERRRKIREEKAMEEFDSTDPAVAWERVGPVLDQALNELPENDRDAILLRFVENRPLKEVGERLGLGESGASRRVSTALEKLRATLARNGVTTTAGALALVTTTQAVQAAPAGLAASVISSSLTSAATTASSSVLLKTLLITMKTKSIIITSVVAVGVAMLGTVWVHHFHQYLRFHRSHAMDDTAQAEFLDEQRQHIQPAMSILLALVSYSGEHGGKFPDSLAQAGIHDNRFEWIGAGVSHTGTTPILRETKTWRTATGKTGRVYGYSDGHAQVLTSGDPDFTE